MIYDEKMKEPLGFENQQTKKAAERITGMAAVPIR
jgi:hypothetical protein